MTQPDLSTVLKPNQFGALDYKDVYLVPQYSEITSRSQVDVSCTLPNGMKMNVPVISANMDTVTEDMMARAMQRGKAGAALHRFTTIERNLDLYAHSPPETWVSIGVNADSKDRAKALYEAGARNFIVDIAHGHCLMMKETIAWLRKEFGQSIMIMAGNVATSKGTTDLIHWGADVIKIGIGPGNVCLTKNVTGVTVPQFSAVAECATVARSVNRPVAIVADGGITEYGDIAKALAAGAHMVMSGKLFASCVEAPGERIDGKKVYRGMASRDAMATIRSTDVLPTAEGLSTLIEASSHSAQYVCEQIRGALQSAFSYSNASNLEQFHANAEWAVRHTQMR